MWLNRQVFGLFLGVIGIIFLMFSSYSAQANTLESMSATASEGVYHHDLKVSAALNYLSHGDEFGVLDESNYSDMDECRPDDIGLYTRDIGASVNVEPFFDGSSDSCGDMVRYLLVPALKEESGSEEFVNLEVGEEE